MRGRECLLLVMSLFLSVSCQKIDVGDEEEEDSTEQTVTPIATGEGTQLAPYTVEQVKDGEIASQQCWVIGYAVGTTYRTMNNANFSANTTYTSNLLLASNSTCTDIANCIPIELASSTIQQKISLYYHSEHHRHAIMVKGMSGRYFNQNGLRNVTEGYWLPDFDLSQIKNPTPTEWEERDSVY